MKILFLAPEPFYQERGTPIAVRLALQVLAERGEDEIDLLVYHEGADVSIKGVRVHRIPAPKWLKGVGPGISFKKLICDFIFFLSVIRMMLKAGNKPYHLVHAVEESVFIARFIKFFWRIPYIYDMDSSLSLQLAEKWVWLRPFRGVLSWMEKIAVKNSIAVVPVCDTLAAIARSHGSDITEVLSDISLLDSEAPEDNSINLRAEACIPESSVMVLYIGNLEPYQGINLLLESFSVVAKEDSSASLVIIGGRSEHIETYRQKANTLGISERVRLVGTRPVENLNAYLRQADILVSPRISGNNTPMKVYSYLHSGIPVVATRLPTHTQVLNDEISKLAAPSPEAFGQAMISLIRSGDTRKKIGKAARALAEEKYTFANFKRTLGGIYDRVAEKIR